MKVYSQNNHFSQFSDASNMKIQQFKLSVVPERLTQGPRWSFFSWQLQKLKPVRLDVHRHQHKNRHQTEFVRSCELPDKMETQKIQIIVVISNQTTQINFHSTSTDLDILKLHCQTNFFSAAWAAGQKQRPYMAFFSRVVRPSTQTRQRMELD